MGISQAFRLFRSRSALAGLAVITTIAALLVLLRPDRLDLGGAVCAALALVLACLPMLQHIATLRDGRLPVLGLVGLFYALFFALPPFYSGFVYPAGTPIVIYGGAPEIAGFDAGVTGLILAGVAALIAGMALARQIPAFPKLRLPQSDPERLAWVARGLLAAQFAFYAIPGLAQIPSLGQLAKPISLLAFCLAAVAAFSHAIGRREALAVFALLLPLRLALGLESGSLNNALILVLVVAVLAASRNRRLLMPMMVAILLGMLAYAPMQVYRHYAWSPHLSETGLARIKAIATSMVSTPFSETIYVPDGPKSVTRAMVWPLAKRLDQATVLAVVVDRTGRDVEPWAGRTLVNLVTGLVPRAIWPNKPAERFGNEFGHRYGLLPADDVLMSINLPWMTEFYANFMLPGLILGMLLTGLGLGLLDRLLNRPGQTDPEAALAATLLLPLAIPESNISLMVSNLPLVGTALWLLLHLAFGRRRRVCD